MKRNVCLAYLNFGGFMVKCAALISVVFVAGCLGTSDGGVPDDIKPIVIENEEKIRDLIDEELDDDLAEEANEIVDLIVAVASTTVTTATVTTASATD